MPSSTCLVDCFGLVYKKTIDYLKRVDMSMKHTFMQIILIFFCLCYSFPIRTRLAYTGSMLRPVDIVRPSQTLVRIREASLPATGARSPPLSVGGVHLHQAMPRLATGPGA